MALEEIGNIIFVMVYLEASIRLRICVVIVE